MKANIAALLLLALLPAAAFVLALNRPISLVPLEGIDGKCLVCARKATRTLPRVAAGLRDHGVYVYSHSEYPTGMPVWCDRHGPDRFRENSRGAYLAAVAAFVVAGTVCEKVRRSA